MRVTARRSFSLFRSSPPNGNLSGRQFSRSLIYRGASRVSHRGSLFASLIDYSRLILPQEMARNYSSGAENGAEGPAITPSVRIPVISNVTPSIENSPTPIDASSSLRKPLSLWPGIYHSPVTQALWEARSSIFERPVNPSGEALPQCELLTKTPSQSRTSILYNFSDDYILREQYRDPWNEVRIGKLLEDLDALAGTIAVKVPILVLHLSYSVILQEKYTLTAKQPKFP